MLWDPGGQYHPVASPWADYSIYSFPDASRIEPADQQPVMDAMNGIIAVNWQATEPHWTAASSPFDRKYSLILVRDDAGLAAFSVYRMLQVADRPAVYRSGTEVLPAHQGRGLYRFMTTEVLKRARALGGNESVLYGWRTRNPIVWAANARICDKVAPSLLGEDHDPALQAACVEMCAALYPGKPLELPGMIMRGAYGHIKHHRQAYRGLAKQVDAAMSRVIPDSGDALFSVGYART
jgi:GNAT superfamily N-acetyltransferase